MEIERARGNEFEAALVAQAEEHQRQINLLMEEKDAALVQAQETAQHAEQHIAEVQNWVTAVQADSQVVREDNERLRVELETAVTAAHDVISSSEAPTAQTFETTSVVQEATPVVELNFVSEEVAVATAAEIEGLKMQLEAERARADEYEASIAAAKEDVASLRELLSDGESERQILQEHSAQLHSKVTELELELASLQQALQIAQHAQQGYGAMPAVPPVFGNETLPLEQYTYSAEQQYAMSANDPTIPAAGVGFENEGGVSAGQDTPEVILLQLELQQAAARAAAAEQQAAEAMQRAAEAAAEAESARGDLAAYVAEASGLKEELTRLQSEASVERIDSPPVTR